MIDTPFPLDQVHWGSFHSWKGEYPSAAGRYFGGGLSWSGNEFKEAKTATRQVLSHVAPRRNSQPEHQLKFGEEGYNQGKIDAEDTIARINNAINSGQLGMPPGGKVIIYLDVELNVQVTPAFWAGFANLVNVYRAGPTTPFTAGIYTPFVSSANGKYLPQVAVRDCLDRANLNWPDAVSLCAGFWASSLEPCGVCSQPAYVPNWDRLGSYSQPYKQATHPILNYVWQYAKYESCVGSGPGECGYPGFANGQKVNFDSRGTTGATNLMLEIV